MAKNDVLVCARADALRTVAGSIFTKTCGRCGVRLMVAPSGQKRIRENPHIAVICGSCFWSTGGKVSDIALSAETVEETMREMESIQPNFWRKRN